jgi:hypothetical protein
MVSVLARPRGLGLGSGKRGFVLRGGGAARAELLLITAIGGETDVGREGGVRVEATYVVVVVSGCIRLPSRLVAVAVGAAGRSQGGGTRSGRRHGSHVNCSHRGQEGDGPGFDRPSQAATVTITARSQIKDG